MNRSCLILASGLLPRLTLLLALSAATAAARTEPLVLPQYDPAAIRDPARAEQAIGDVAQARQSVRARAERERADCQRRFAVNACLDEVTTRRAEQEQRLRRIESAARAAIRHDRAIRLNERQARQAAERESTRVEQQERREAARARYEERQQQAQRRATQREAEAIERRRRADGAR